jgi:hypothetical protein
MMMAFTEKRDILGAMITGWQCAIEWRDEVRLLTGDEADMILRCGLGANMSS